jgi:thioredoxin-like negative regulator of GroEL
MNMRTNAIERQDAPARRMTSILSTLEALYATGYELLAQERIANAASAFRTMLRIAPRDERAWLGVGECHERAGQLRIAIELYGAGSVAAAKNGHASVRCLLARARLLFKLGCDVSEAIQRAHASARNSGEVDLMALVGEEERRLS